MKRFALGLAPLLALVVTAQGSTAGAPAAAPAPAADRPDDGTYGYVPTMPVAPQGIDRLSAFSDGTAYVKHSSGGVPLLARSTDFGRTWTKLPDPPFGAHADTRFATQRRGFSIGNGVVSTSTDGGQTWLPTTQVHRVPGDFATLYGLGVGKGMSAGVLHVAGDVYGPPKVGLNYPVASYIWSSSDGGRRWSRTRMPADLLVDDIRVHDRKRAVARVYDMVNGVGNRNAIWTTDNGGRTWRRAFDCPQICTSVAYADAKRLYAGTVTGRLFGSADGGRRWSARHVFSMPAPRPEPAVERTHWVSGIAFTPDGRTAVLGTNGRGTYRSTDGGRAWTLESPSPQEVYGIGIGDAAIFDRQRAIVGGPNAIAVRVPLEQVTAPAAPAAPGVAVDAGAVLSATPLVTHLADGSVRVQLARS